MEQIIETISNHLDGLAYLLNKEKLIEPFSALRKSLEAYSFYLKKYDHIVTVDLQITSETCIICTNPIKKRNMDQSILLNCKDIVCSKA